MKTPLTAPMLAQHIAILGKTGSGKTTAAKGAVESILDAGGRVCVIDPTGAWWGMKSSPTGKSAGYPFVIFGGSHGDFPLREGDGEALAEIVGTSSTPVIVDTSQLKVRERTKFFADFADAVMRKNRGPLHLVVDEAHVFMPQGKVPDPQSGLMLAAGCNMVSGGRSRGLRITLISQRPAKLHKDALTQVETLVALRLIAPQDRKAVEEWIKDNADAVTGRQIMESLAQLKTGQGWIWSPEAGVLERVQFPRIHTFDSSAAPDGSEQDGPVLAPIDRDKIAERLKTVAADIVANDPATMRRRIAELETQLRVAKMPDPSANLAAELELTKAVNEARRKGIDEGIAVATSTISSRLMAIHKAGEDLLEQLRKAANEAVPVPTTLSPVYPSDTLRLPTPPMSFMENATVLPAATLRAGDSISIRSTGRIKSTPTDLRVELVGNAGLPKGEAVTLTALIQFPDGLRRDQLTVLTGYKKSSRDSFVQRLRERGFVSGDGDRIVATRAGIDAMPDAEPLPTGAALREYWLARLPEGERKLLQVLVDNYPNILRRDALSDATGYKKSSRDSFLQRLNAKQLIEEPTRGWVRAIETLF